MRHKTVSQKKNDTMLKVIAIICALLLWFYAEAQENPSKERQLAVSVQYINLAEDYIVENKNQTIQITIKGNETDIMSLRSDDFCAEVDLSNAIIGTASYPVKVSGTAVNERFTYTPETIDITIDQIRQKEVPIRVCTEGSLPQYYELQQIAVQPESVIIRGKSKLLDEITEIETAIVSLEEHKQDITLAVALQLPAGVTAKNDLGNFSNALETVVVLQIQPMHATKSLETTIALRNVPEGMNASSDTQKATMLLKGEAELLATQPILDQLLLYVDCEGLTAGEHILPIQVEASNLSVNQALRSISPQTVTVRLSSQGADVSEREESDFSTGSNDSNKQVNETIVTE